MQVPVVAWTVPGGGPGWGGPAPAPVQAVRPAPEALGPRADRARERVLEGELLRNRRRRPRPEGPLPAAAHRALVAYLGVQEPSFAPARLDLYV